MLHNEFCFKLSYTRNMTLSYIVVRSTAHVVVYLRKLKSEFLVSLLSRKSNRKASINDEAVARTSVALRTRGRPPCFAKRHQSDRPPRRLFVFWMPATSLLRSINTSIHRFVARSLPTRSRSGRMTRTMRRYRLPVVKRRRSLLDSVA